MNKRISFIRNRQQMNNPRDLRDGAYMVYDCEADSIYPNNTPNCNPVDRDEGAERVGMGVLLAKQYLLSDKKDNDLKSSLLRYAKFLRTRLQTPEYVTYSSVDQKNRNRAYNYVWIAEFYFYMYRATGNRQFVRDGYENASFHVSPVRSWLLRHRLSGMFRVAMFERSQDGERTPATAG